MWIEPITLNGKHCTLEPLHPDHHDGLIETVADGELWKLRFTGIPHPKEMKNEILKRLELQKKGLMSPFVIIHTSSQKIAGMTTYCHIEEINKRLNIGFTWYAKKHQRTALNTDCKLTLLTHAFEQLKTIAVGFRADYLNRPSRRAIERLGAKYEGMMRNYGTYTDGSTRDMCFYSILPHEWPNIKLHLLSFGSGRFNCKENS